MRGSLLLRLAVAAATAVALLVLAAPATPARRLGIPAATFAGAAAGLVLYVAVAHRRPYIPSRAPAALAACGILVIAAASEEVVWRRVVLGELLRAGPVAATAGSTLGFALVHRTRQSLHLGTGATFAALYLATGALAAAIAAHWAYNVLLLALAERSAGGLEAPP
jgi:membrane protease YdiL (CAAX protease family)